MKYFIVEGTFAKPIEQYSNIEELLKGHFAFSERGIQEGWMLFGGPKLPGGGFSLLRQKRLRLQKHTLRRIRSTLEV